MMKSEHANTRRLIAGFVALMMSTTPLVATSLAIGSLTLGSVALADAAGGNGTSGVAEDGEGAFQNVTDTVCAVADGMTGPLGVGIGFLVLVAGLISLQVASRDAVPMIARAAIGTALILGSSTAFAALLGPACEGGGDDSSLPYDQLVQQPQLALFDLSVLKES